MRGAARPLVPRPRPEGETFLLHKLARAPFRRATKPGAVSPARPPLSVATLIASKDGEATIARTIRSIREQSDVFVVSDGSADDTAEVAAEAGAAVFALRENVGKPAAIYRAIKVWGLTERYDAIVILDDDTVVAPDFVARSLAAMRPGVGIVVGRTLTQWNRDRRWNVWLGSRAYAYWRYQATIRRAQSAFNVLNCISGSNSVYRSSLLDQVLVPNTPYIVDDTYWTLETHRRKLGRIVYEPAAHAYVQDPTSMRAWYRQNLRWLWGTFQGIRGHRCGRRRSWFDLAYLMMMVDWVLYVVGGPVMIGLVAASILWDPVWVLAGIVVGSFVWTIPAAAATRKWRLVPMTPLFIAIDWLYRLVFLHAFIKALRQPTVVSCRWESPARY
jgi:biofilm PGA synthesis N-glycosyltransferase PgaC